AHDLAVEEEAQVGRAEERVPVARLHGEAALPPVELEAVETIAGGVGDEPPEARLEGRERVVAPALGGVVLERAGDGRAVLRGGAGLREEEERVALEDLALGEIALVARAGGPQAPEQLEDAQVGAEGRVAHEGGAALAHLDEA